MKSFLLISLLMGSVAFAVPGNDPNLVDDSQTTSEAAVATSDCDDKLIAAALGDETTVGRKPEVKPLGSQKKTSQLQKIESESSVQVAVHSDPFGSPCRFR